MISSLNFTPGSMLTSMFRVFQGQILKHENVQPSGAVPLVLLERKQERWAELASV